MTDETIQQNQNAILQAVVQLSGKFDSLENKVDSLQNEVNSLRSDFNSFKQETNLQLESIREGISYNSSIFDRLEGNVLHLRADVRDIGEELRKDKMALK